jgi:hypothetical protein
MNLWHEGLKWHARFSWHAAFTAVPFFPQPTLLYEEECMLRPTQLPVKSVRGRGVLSAGQTAAGRDADHSPPSSAEAKNE